MSMETPGPAVYMGGMQSQIVPLSALEKLRGQVREADFMAAQIIAKAGYDPRALVRYIGRVQPQGTPDAPRPGRHGTRGSPCWKMSLPSCRRIQKTRPATSIAFKNDFEDW